MDDSILNEFGSALEKLWEEEGMCGKCASKKHKTADCTVVVVNPDPNSPIGTTNVKGNLARRAYNDASNETKIKAARKAVKPATDA